MTSHEIRVFVHLPVRIAKPLDLDCKNWAWTHLLTFPVSTLNERRFSHKPYKWVRFVTGIIIRAQGQLSPQKVGLNSTAPVLCNYDYSGDLPSQFLELYYHTTDEEKLQMLPIDLNVLDERTSVTHTSVRDPDFSDNVAERDGCCCILTGDPDECEAAHIISLMKGNEYIKALTGRKCSIRASEDVIDDINDVRNGIFVGRNVHKAFGMRLAFLVTPNFAMDVSDVPGPANMPTHTPTGCSLHVFKGNAVIGVTPQEVIVKSGSPVRVADKDWPPAVLFDALYASVALRTFGVKASIESMKEVWKDELSFGLTLGTLSERKRSATRYGTKCEDGVELDGLDMLNLIPYMAASPQQVREVWAADRRQQEMDAQRESETKVYE